MGEFRSAPEGLSIEAVDWLPSGGRSGLVRVRGHWQGAAEIALPVLVVEHAGEVLRHESLPDPRAGREPGAWRGAYVVHADLVAAADARLTLEFPGGVRIALPRPTETAPAAPAGGDVVDRAVLADRRARRAEAAEQAQARIAREALKAVEVLELRAAELEQRLQSVTTERDALSARAGHAPDPEVNALRVRLAQAEARVQELRSAPTSDRRAERLREALTTALTTVGELRLQLHEARVRSRTSEIAAAADAVRLTVLASERAGLVAEIEALRGGLAEAEQLRTIQAAEIERVNARAAGAEAAHEETRRGLVERLAELRSARERIGALEAELAALRAEIPEQVRAAVATSKQDFAAREAAAQAAFESARQELERAEAAAREDAARAEAALARAETETEMARAAAAAAEMRLRAADVAHAAGSSLPSTAPDREQLAAVTAELGTARAAADALLAELDQARTLLSTQGDALEAARARALAAEEDAAMVATLTSELDSARAELQSLRGLAAELEAERARRRAAEAALEEASPAAPVDEPAPFAPPMPPDLAQQAAVQEQAAAASDPAPDTQRVVADLAAAAEKLRARAEIVSAPDAPSPVATGRGAREYPALRGALVKLAHDDPASAARLLAGLLPAQWRAVAEPVDYDLTIAEAGTFAVTVAAGAAHVRPVAGPRKEAEFHLRTDALTLAELLAGHGPRPRRFGGRARVSGKARRLKVLQPLTSTTLSLPDALRAGASLEPELVLRTLAYAVHPSWTAGHDFTIAHTFTGPEGEETLYLLARDGRGLTVTHEPPADPPSATVVLSRAAFEAMLRGDAPPPGERPATRGDHRAAQTLRAWADRARAGG